jgi:hypothetical protein
MRFAHWMSCTMHGHPPHSAFSTPARWMGRATACVRPARPRCGIHSVDTRHGVGRFSSDTDTMTVASGRRESNCHGQPTTAASSRSLTRSLQIADVARRRDGRWVVDPAVSCGCSLSPGRPPRAVATGVVGSEPPTSADRDERPARAPDQAGRPSQHTRSGRTKEVPSSPEQPDWFDRHHASVLAGVKVVRPRFAAGAPP